jgi:DNA gyrase/topoisomerase IV subunit A
MQYHPHGDASIGDALVNMGQKDLLIDTQGNWAMYVQVMKQRRHVILKQG